MAKKRTAPSEAEPRAAVTVERFARLYCLLNLLAAGPQTRARLTRSLKLDVRGFYRDLELLRKAGITVTLAEGRYTLAGDVEDALARLPFPDPLLTLGEAVQLARGRTAAHRKLRGQIEQIRP
jgi:predicted DNA-binding transcriptional regulator YafY